VIALDRTDRRNGNAGSGADWYRMRQRRLLGDALLLVPRDPEPAATAIVALLADAERCRAMGVAGRVRMGPTGGTVAIAAAIEDLVR
jgi:hypothetical protein